MLKRLIALALMAALLCLAGSVLAEEGEIVIEDGEIIIEEAVLLIRRRTGDTRSRPVGGIERADGLYRPDGRAWQGTV